MVIVLDDARFYLFIQMVDRDTVDTGIPCKKYIRLCVSLANIETIKVMAFNTSIVPLFYGYVIWILDIWKNLISLILVHAHREIHTIFVVEKYFFSQSVNRSHAQRFII